jgi:shikimate kinase
LPPSGLLGALWKVVSETRDVITVVLRDTPEYILRRINFYDIESRPMQKNLTDHEKDLYLREIKRDIAYFKRSFRRADVSVDISGCGLDDASRRVWDILKSARPKERTDASGQRAAMMHARA